MTVEPEATRVVFGKTLAEIGGMEPRLIVFEADISKSTNTFHFAKRFPERFFNVGVAEQNMMCLAAGAAAAGLLPFCSTFAMFAGLRTCEMVRTSIAYPRLNVKIVAPNAGVEICGDGVTHQATEDIAVMRSIPNMTVMALSDPVSARKAAFALMEHDGPVYVRLGRQVRAVLHGESLDFRIGRMIRLREGRDLAIIACGSMVEEAVRAAAALSAEGIEARVLDCHTIKPLDVDEVCAAAAETGGIVTAEDHNIIGGLGGAVAELVSERCPAPVRRVGLRDQFASSGRDYRKLMAAYRIDAAAIVEAARGLLAPRL